MKAFDEKLCFNYKTFIAGNLEKQFDWKFEPEDIKNFAVDDSSKEVANAHDAEEVRGGVLVYHSKAVEYKGHLKG